MGILKVRYIRPDDNDSFPYMCIWERCLYYAKASYEVYEAYMPECTRGEEYDMIIFIDKVPFYVRSCHFEEVKGVTYDIS